MTEIIDTFANRLNYAITVKNLKPAEISRQTGISKPNLSYYMSGKYEPKQDGIKLLSDFLNVDPVWLLGYDVPMEKDSFDEKIKSVTEYMKQHNLSSIKLIPLYDKLTAKNCWSEENVTGYIPFSPIVNGFSDNEDYFYLEITNEDMNQVIKNNDFALIQKCDSATNGDIIVALVNGNNAILRKYKEINNQFISLEPMSNDANIESIIVDLKTKSFNILGKFVGYFGKYEK